MKIFGTINRVEKQEDGTLMVHGIASSGARDSHRTVITPDAMRAAIPDYMRFANVREMHDPTKAAGVTERMEVDDEGYTNVVVRVVDPVAILKCESGVYKGFSIGGKDAVFNPDDKTQIDRLRLTELSLVDRPSNPEAVFDVYRIEGEAPADDGIIIGGDEEEVTRGEPEQIEQPAATVVERTAVIDGKESLMRSDDGGATWKFVEQPDETRGSYSIGELARLAESLESFANCRAWDNGGEGSAIPDAARKLAGQLYDMLITLVAEDVATAKQRLKDAKRNDDSNSIERAHVLVLESGARNMEDLQRIIAFRNELGEDALTVYVAGELGRFASDGASIQRLESFIAAAGELAAKLDTIPAPSPLERAAAKEVDNGSTEHSQEPEPTDTLGIIKRVHATGGQRTF